MKYFTTLKNTKCLKINAFNIFLISLHLLIDSLKKYIYNINHFLLKLSIYIIIQYVKQYLPSSVSRWLMLPSHSLKKKKNSLIRENSLNGYSVFFPSISTNLEKVIVFLRYLSTYLFLYSPHLWPGWCTPLTCDQDDELPSPVARMMYSPHLWPGWRTPPHM